MKIKERLACLAFVCVFATMGQIAFAEVKDRYLYFALGISNVRYDKGGKTDIRLGAMEKPSNITWAAEIGPYYSLPNGKTLIGANGNVTFEQHKESENRLRIIQYLISLSTMHFLSKEIGQGFFFRADLGYAGAVWNTSGSGPLMVIGSEGETTLTEGTESGGGVGFLVGGGYAIPIKGGYTGLLNLSYANRFIKGERHQTFTLNLGGFFD